MFKSRWIVTATLGLIVLVAGVWFSWLEFSAYQQRHSYERASAAEYYANATEHGPGACRAIVGETGLIDWLTCLADNVGTDSSVKQAEYDLKAQQDMAAWAFGMLIATVWLTLITLFGVFFVWRTLVATQKMSLDTREIGEAQARAYLHVDFIQVGTEVFANADGSNLKFFAKIKVINSGATPAYGVEVLYDIQEGQSGRIEEFNLLKDGQILTERLSFIPQKGQQTPNSRGFGERTIQTACCVAGITIFG